MTKESSYSETESHPESLKEIDSSNDIQPAEADELLPVDIDILPKTDIFGIPHRFNIMMILYNYERIGFTSLRKTLKLTSGNLEHHIQKLIVLGWIEPFFIFSFRPLQYYRITEKGKVALRGHAEKLKKMLESL